MKTIGNLNEGARRRFDDPRIIEFKPRPRWRRRNRMAIVDPLRQFDMDEYRLRMQQNLAAIVALALFLVAGLWLFHALKTSSHTLQCVEAGFQNCIPSDQRESGKLR
jgi:hypothetical protein